MYKHVALLVRDPSLSHQAFVDRWESTHTPIAREIEGVVRYTTVIPVDPERSEFDGLAELYFEDLEALYDAVGEEGPWDADTDRGEVRGAGGDVTDFLTSGGRPRFIGGEVLELDRTGGDTTGLYKHSAFLVRKAGLSHGAFLEHWAEEHVPIAREIPGVVRYARVLPARPDATEFDGIAELYFEDLGALRAALGDEGSRDYDPDDPAAAAAREDVDNFLAIEERPRVVGVETVQKDVTGGGS